MISSQIWNKITTHSAHAISRNIKQILGLFVLIRTILARWIKMSMKILIFESFLKKKSLKMLACRLNIHMAAE